MRTQQLFSVRFITAVVVLTLAALVPSAFASSGQLPPGAYVATVMASDVPPDFPPEVAAILIGTWTTEFTNDGRTVVTKNGEIVVTGSYTSNKSYVVMRDIEGPLACTDDHGIATGVYNWRLAGGQLYMSPVLDRCFGRQFVLTLRPLEQQ